MVAYRSKEVNESGKRSMVMSPAQALEPDSPIKLPCGQCIGCRLERSRQWAVRCVHEASLYEKNCFITLTYDERSLPRDGSLVLEHFQKFMKRLRSRFEHKIRFYHCGEYGEEFGRPHYHAILFNHDFSDKELVCYSGSEPLYQSKTLQELWPYGLSRIGSVSFESAAYVARYCTKKVTGKSALAHYNRIDYFTGEVLCEKKPEYATMSRRPGIGRDWLKKFYPDVYPHDSFHINGKEVRPPKFYDTQFELLDPVQFELVKARRLEEQRLAASDNSYERLTVKEKVTQSHLNVFFSRRLENGE